MSNITQMRVKGVDYDLSNPINSTKTNSLENLDCSKNLIQATVSKATKFSLKGEMWVGQKIKLFIISNGKFVQPILGNNIKTDFDTGIDINKGDIIPLEIECYDTNKYFISAKTDVKNPPYYILVSTKSSGSATIYKYTNQEGTETEQITIPAGSTDYKVDDLKYGFKTDSNGGPHITKIDATHLDTFNLTSMGQMFANCSSLTSLDLSNFDTSKVTSMSQMFANCSSLTSLDLSNFDTSKMITIGGTYIGGMFVGCSKLTHIKCKQVFKDWCWTNQGVITLPSAMREGGGGTWEIVG